MGNKRLYITRHAKSDWAQIGLDDVDRPLNERGQQDAPAMAQRMKKLGYSIEHIVSSHAVRAFETARCFHAEFPNAVLTKEHQLYHADIDEIIHTCLELDPNSNNVMLVCHNPGITYFANVICGANLNNVPTCGVLVIDIETEDWSSIDMSKFTLHQFLYPKMNHD